MPNPPLSLDADVFSEVASKCRWSERSLSVARDLLVEGASLSDVAEKNQMTPQQANVIRTRFMEKAERQRLSAFMAREKPKQAAPQLDRFSADVRTLKDKGYTVDQIVAYLAENGLTTSVTTVRKFLRTLPQ